jgi:hypothetical protein
MSKIEINRLKSASELKGKIKQIFTLEQLEQLAKNYGLPHYILLNPITKEELIYFDQSEIDEWVAANFLKKNDCKTQLNLSFFYFNSDSHKIKDLSAVPKELININNLFEIPFEIINTPPGVYFLCYRSEIVYIGQAKNVSFRVAEHIKEREKEFDTIYFIPCPINQLDVLESSLIRHIRPKYNIGRMGESRHTDKLVYESLCLIQAGN